MTLYKMSPYFPKQYEHSRRKIKVELDLFNYAIQKTDLKGAAGVDTSELAAKSDLVSLKAKADKLDVDKLKTVPTDLSKIINVVDEDVINFTMYDKLDIDTSRFEKKLVMQIRKYLVLVELLKSSLQCKNY